MRHIPFRPTSFRLPTKRPRTPELPDLRDLPQLTPDDIRTMDKDLRWKLFGDKQADLIPAMLEINKIMNPKPKAASAEAPTPIDKLLKKSTAWNAMNGGEGHEPEEGSSGGTAERDSVFRLEMYENPVAETEDEIIPVIINDVAGRADAYSREYGGFIVPAFGTVIDEEGNVQRASDGYAIKRGGVTYTIRAGSEDEFNAGSPPGDAEAGWHSHPQAGNTWPTHSLGNAIGRDGDMYLYTDGDIAWVFHENKPLYIVTASGDERYIIKDEIGTGRHPDHGDVLIYNPY